MVYDADMIGALYADIVFDRAVRRAFTYRLPEECAGLARPGCRVLAPLLKRPTLGFIHRLKRETDLPPEKVHPITRLVDPQPVLIPEVLELCEWIAEYYFCALGEACFAAYPFSPDLRAKTETVFLPGGSAQELGSLASELEAHRAKAQAAVLREVLRANYQPATLAELAGRAGVGGDAVRALLKRGILCAQERELIRHPQPGEPLFGYAAPTLNPAQQHVLAAIARAQAEQRFETFLLHGITGSGKTEVYIRAIESVLAAGRTALVLVPEISLTPQAMERYRSRLGDRVGILHSALSGGERYDAWRRARRGDLSVIVGTRSAVFAPLSNLGLIVVDEEHDTSYKQDDPAPRYHGRDVALVRARRAGCPIVLGSATPALESYTNALEKKYTLLTLPRRAVEHDLPDVHLVDMRGHDPDKGPLSEELADALDQCLQADGQAILFLNRRGFSPQVLCAKCGHIVQCPSCSVALVQHRNPPGLLCHHCEHREPEPRICPACHGEWMRYRGVGTEQLAQWVQENYENVRVQRMDLDSTRAKDAHTRMLSAFRRRETDVLVGTQMISKGLDMPGVTLVGVVDADIGLAMPDFRSAERTYTLLTQVAGRAGRGEHPGRVFIQSHCPNHYAVELAIAQNYGAFYEREARYRKAVHFPPFCKMILVRVDCEDEGETKRLSRRLAEAARSYQANSPTPVRVLPPSEAPISRVKNRYRWQFAALHPSYRALAGLLKHPEFVALSTSELKLGARVSVDVDPLSVL